MMIKLTIGNNTDRKRDIFEDNKPIGQLFAESGLNVPSGAVFHLNSTPLPRDAANMTLADVGAANGDYLIIVKKADNA